MKRTLSAILFTLLLMLVTGSASFAQVTAVPQMMNFQGRLARPDGTPVADGTYSVRFALYSALTGGLETWNQTVASVPVKHGTFTVPLSGFPTGTFNTDQYLQIKIGTDTPLTPRQKLVTVPYAFKADMALTVPNGSITNAKLANGTITADKFAANIFNPLAWLLGGNSGTNPATHFLGTTDNQPLNFRVNNQRALQMQYVLNGNYLGNNLLGGYWLNSITAGVTQATVLGGGKYTTTEYPNRVTDHGGTVSGGGGNQAGNNNATLEDAQYATVGGGSSNTASNEYATVGGGNTNAASGFSATAGGGYVNTAINEYATVGGGAINIASGVASTVGGGESNTVSGTVATVGGGYSNLNSGESATIAGGNDNEASGTGAAVGGGVGNLVSGQQATVPGGLQNTAAGQFSFAAGRRAKANHNGAFVWGDSTNADFGSTAVNQFNVRASGGVRIFTKSDLSIGVTLLANDSSWNAVSDRNAKTAFHPIDTLDVLECLVTIPITTWNYKNVENPIRHIGPMAQDFFAAFKVGMDDKHIGTIDADGVAFAAIQGLNRKLEAQNAELKKRQAAIEAENAELRTELETLKAAVRQLQNNAK